MLNKKIVSLISALTMALSMCSFVSVQAADVPAADLEFKVEKNIFDPDTYADGYQEYTITVSLNTENIALTDNGKSGALKRFTGSRVSSFAGKINFDTTKFYTDNSMMSTSFTGGNPLIGPLDTGVTFNWYSTTYTEGLEGDVELFKIDLYAMDADGNPTMGESDEFESLFSWDTTSRSVSYCEWANAKAAELLMSSPKVLGDNTAEAGWVGNLGIEKDEPIVPPTPVEDIVISDRIDLTADGNIGAAWDVTINEFDSTKSYVASFTNLDDAEDTRDAKAIAGLDTIAETEGGVNFAVLLYLNQARNVALSIAAE